MSDSLEGVNERRLPRLLWIGVPILGLAGPPLARAIDDGFYRSVLRGERGVIEGGTVLFLVLATIAAISLLVRDAKGTARFPKRWLKGWFVLFALGCIYFGGEEASWGQHWFGWSTPEALAEANKQQETNLHNLDGIWNALLDKLPRNLLTLAALVGGVIGAVVLRKRRRAEGLNFSTVRDWVWPTMVCLPAALGAVLVSVPEKLFEAADKEVPRVIDISPGETKELMLACFLC
ncbi:MAG: hypothetical protein AAF368_20235, partial [Planctomycetota bacterium]